APELVLEQVAQQLHRQVLEGERGAVRQAQQEEARLQALDRGDLRRAEHLGRVGAVHDVAKRLRIDVADVARQDLEGERRIVELAPAGERCRGDARIALRHPQPAVGREAAEQDLGEAGGRHPAAGRDVLHRQSSSSRRIRTTSPSTVGIAWIASMAETIRLSSDTWVSRMTSVCPSSSESFCRAASIEMPASARWPVMRASTPGWSATRMRR